MKILVDCSTGFNFGDLAMAEGVVARLRHQFPHAELTLAEQPGQTDALRSAYRIRKASYRIVQQAELALARLNPVPIAWRLSSNPALRRLSFVALLRFFCSGGRFEEVPLRLFDEKGESILPLREYCQAFDALHIPGGGFLSDEGPEFYPDLFRLGCLLCVFVRQGKPVLLTGQQVGPFHSRAFRRILLRIFGRADFLGVREPEDSPRHWAAAGVSARKVVLMGDDSFGMAPDPSAASYLQTLNLPPGGFLAANVRFASYSPGHVRYLRHLAELFRRLSRHFGMPLVLVPISPAGADSDIASARRLVAESGCAEFRVLDSPQLTPALVKGILGHAWGAVGNSYHFCTFALSGGVPAVALYDGAYYSQKARGICAFWKDRRFGLSLETGLEEQFQRIVALFSDDAVRPLLKARAAALQAEWESIFDATVRTYFGRTMPAVPLSAGSLTEAADVSTPPALGSAGSP
jgi:polysaccharide pyruvyl transferase WcaK-like protein